MDKDKVKKVKEILEKDFKIKDFDFKDFCYSVSGDLLGIADMDNNIKIFSGEDLVKLEGILDMIKD